MGSELKNKIQKLKEIFESMGKVVVAFSGGVDSTFLLKIARDTLGVKNVLAVTALSPLYPERELRGAKKMAEEYQLKTIYVFMAANQNGTTFAEQLVEQNVQIGWNTRLVPFGPDISAAVFALGFANRAGMAFQNRQWCPSCLVPKP